MYKCLILCLISLNLCSAFPIFYKNALFLKQEKTFGHLHLDTFYFIDDLTFTKEIEMSNMYYNLQKFDNFVFHIFLIKITEIHELFFNF